ncbi:hypothetical protein BBJ28_00005980 [Nothophytophthora sp. Chile5]|nr:hypothetical protein BBJ28_00005980 [Nothophytophthora sp. Chile5]
MQRFLRSVFLAVVTVVAISPGGSNAAECTDSEAAYADEVWLTAATTSACSQYATQTNPVYVSAPCTATSCISVMEQVAEDLPDCTYSGINNKIEVENALTVCNGGSTTDPGSITTTAPSTDAPEVTTATTAATPTPTSSSTTDCTTDEYQSTIDLYDTAAASSACSPYASSSTVLVSVYAPCSATDCVDVMTQLASDLPDCLYDGSNEKAELEDGLTVCGVDSSGEVDSSTPTGDSSTLAPTSTASNTDCTTSEVNDMWNSFITTATSSACADDSIISAYSIYIDTLCSSACADKIKALAEDLPNCYYYYEFINKKEELLDDIDSCSDYSTYMYISMYPDDSIDSTSATSTPAATADSTTDGTSSSFGTTSGASAPSSSIIVLSLWLVATLLTAVRLQ